MSLKPDALNKIIHEPARLLIMTHLFVVSDADFVYLKRATGMTAGNLSTHLTKLENAGFVKIVKSFEGKKPKTTCKLTAKGRKDFQEYRKNILKVMSGEID